MKVLRENKQKVFEGVIDYASLNGKGELVLEIKTHARNTTYFVVLNKSDIKAMNYPESLL